MFWPAPTEGNDGILTEERIKELERTAQATREYQLTAQEPDSSVFNLYKLAYKYSTQRDSVNASKYFLKVDPYLFMSRGIDDSTITDFLKRYQLTRAATNRYKEIFLHAYNSQHSGSFDTLQRFNKNIEQSKKMLDTARAALKDYILQQFIKEDSIRFAYLRRYIEQNGWPALRDGSIYAATIAARDIEHFNFYLPYLNDIVAKGDLALAQAKTIDASKFSYYYYMMLKDSRKYRQGYFDVTAFKDNRRKHFLASPSLKADILYAIKQNKPIIDFFFVNFSRNPYLTERETGKAPPGNACLEVIDAIRSVFDFKPNQGEYTTSCKRLYLPNLYYLNDKEFFYIIY